MKRYTWWLLVAVVSVGIAVSLVALPRRPAWTTSSDEALSEFLAGVEAQQKLYGADAADHFERAVALDPHFVVAKMFLAEMVRERDTKRAAALVSEVLEAPTDGLTPRERMLIARLRALQEHRPEDAAVLVDDYLDDHPDDPYVLYVKAMRLWSDDELEPAERLFRRLIEIEPNWVIAYNQLGYIAMLQGRFVEAEEYFTSYRFVAPDQANPHDSLGELYLIQGRYDEAIESFERALSIRPDFVPAYSHLAIAMIMQDRFDDARAVSARLAGLEGVSKVALRDLDCVVDLAELEAGEQWSEIVARRDECVRDESFGYVSYVVVVTDRAAVLAGARDVALALEDHAEAALADHDRHGKSMFGSDILLDHMRGVRLAFDGDLEAAAKLLYAADQRLTYREAGLGLLKLLNRLLLVEVRFAQGRDAEAHTLLSQVRAVNPALVEDFEEHGMHYLGLQRLARPASR